MTGLMGKPLRLKFEVIIHTSQQGAHYDRLSNVDDSGSDCNHLCGQGLDPH